MKSGFQNIVLLLFLCVAFTSCSPQQNGAAAIINQKASLAGNLPFNPFRWCVITIGVDGQASTMFTLYGNDVATQHARTGPQGPYPVGSQLALVTWFQQEDDHWFGARTPAAIKSIEFIRVEPGNDEGPSYAYRIFDGSPLKEKTIKQTDDWQRRVDTMLSHRAAVMP
jgi:hypothetical protein